MTSSVATSPSRQTTGRTIRAPEPRDIVHASPSRVSQQKSSVAGDNEKIDTANGRDFVSPPVAGSSSDARGERQSKTDESRRRMPQCSLEQARDWYTKRKEGDKHVKLPSHKLMGELENRDHVRILPIYQMNCTHMF